MINLISIIFFYLVISLFNWTIDLNHWNSFSIFAYGFIVSSILTDFVKKKPQGTVFNNLN